MTASTSPWAPWSRSSGRPCATPSIWATCSAGNGKGAGNGTRPWAVSAVFAERDRDDWVRHFAAYDACVEPVLDLPEALEHRQAAARKAVVEQRAGESVLRTVRSPLRLSHTPVSARHDAPAFGAHTEEVLREAGFGASEIEGMRNAGVVQ